jgi:hypothetical protein
VTSFSAGGRPAGAEVLQQEAGGCARRSGHLGLSLIVAASLLAGCGDSQTAAPPPSSSTTTAASPTLSVSPSPSGSGGWTADGASFGVDRARWPTTVRDAKVVLDRLPQTFAGQARETYATPGEDGSGPDAGAGYGEDVTVNVSEEYLSNDTEDGSPELLNARDLLAANFMLGLSCSEDGYRGNALPLDDEGYPKVRAGQPIWFSCPVDGAEGDEDFTAHAAGWTSGKTAWLILAPDRDAVRSLVTALHSAGS